MNRKALTRIIGAVVAVGALVIVGAYIIFPLAANGKLPGQKQPTAIPVTPFANISATTPASAMVVAATPATTASTTTAGSVTTGAASSGTTTFAVNADQSQAKVTVNEKLAFLPSNS